MFNQTYGAHITPLVINSFGDTSHTHARMHTHTHTHTYRSHTQKHL